MHRAESIMQAIEQRLTGLATTGSRIERARVWPVEECPALSIERGDDAPMDNGRSLGFQSRQLEVFVTAYAKSPTGTFETSLHQIAAEVYAALFADVTQGLPYVMDTHWTGDSRPETSTETEGRTATMQMAYQIHYRHSIATPEG